MASGNSPTRSVASNGSHSGSHNTISYVTTQSQGNAVDFGDTTVSQSSRRACNSPTRMVIGGGGDPSYETIDFFTSALRDDFNTSKALKILQKISQRINLNKNDNKTKEKLLNSLKVLGNILGILNNSSQEYFQYDLSKKISSKDIELMIEERDQARINKDFKKADLIREKLSSLNIVLEDDGKKTTWKKLSKK